MSLSDWKTFSSLKVPQKLDAFFLLVINELLRIGLFYCLEQLSITGDVSQQKFAGKVSYSYGYLKLLSLLFP